jgi:hypothetical protein
MLKRLKSQILHKLAPPDPAPQPPPPRPAQRQAEHSAYEPTHPLSFRAFKRNRGRSSVPKMSMAEIKHAYKLREAEQARSQAELQFEFERARAELAAGIQPIQPPSHETRSIMDRDF